MTDIQRISIIIRSKNEERSIGETLTQIFEQDVNLPFEVVLVDSGSTDRTLEIAGRYRVNIVHIPSSRFTYGYALNQGIGQSSGEILCCLSAHCLPANDQWLGNLIRPIVDGTAHATYGRQIPVAGMNPFEEVSLRKHFPAEGKKAGRVPFSNANSAFLKTMWCDVRFDEEIPEWEDYLWYLKLEKSFQFRYVPDAAVFHSHPFAIHAIISKAYRYGQSFRTIKEKHGFDVIHDACPTLTDKIMVIMEDLMRHIKIFAKEGHVKYLFLLPIVRVCAYGAYWKGYASKKQGKIP